MKAADQGSLQSKPSSPGLPTALQYQFTREDQGSPSSSHLPTWGMLSSFPSSRTAWRPKNSHSCRAVLMIRCLTEPRGAPPAGCPAVLVAGRRWERSGDFFLPAHPVLNMSNTISRDWMVRIFMGLIGSVSGFSGTSCGTASFWPFVSPVHAAGRFHIRGYPVWRPSGLRRTRWGYSPSPVRHAARTCPPTVSSHGLPSLRV